MIVITTHLNADFDCLASMVAAKKLHPTGVLLFPGSQEKSVRLFLEKTGFPLNAARLKNFDFKKVSKLVIVDTASKERLGPLSRICESSGIELEIYDHHPESEKDLHGKISRIEKRGSNTTLMVEILREKGIGMTPEEATLFMLGIYEDTGSLTFSSTCPEDLKAAAYLLTKGANLNTVSDFLHRNLTAAQVDMLRDLLERLEFHNINGVEVAIARAVAKRHVGDVSMVVHALKDMENLNALFVIVEMEKRLHLVARSRVGAVDAGAIASRLGGGGHPTAASATIKDMLMDEAMGALMKALNASIAPASTAAEMMVSPAITVSKNDTLETVEKTLTRHNINSVPVAESGRAVGLITRQVVEKSLYHGLGAEKTADYMQTDFGQVTVDSPSDAINDLIIRKKQKLVPVAGKNGQLIGIISRSDVMRVLYSDMLKAPSTMLQPHRRVNRPVARDMKGVMNEHLAKEMLGLIEKASICADECGYTAYAVGGFTRDLLMRRKNLDIDIVIEGDGIEFAKRFTAKHGGRVKAHKKFQTAIMLIPGYHKIDIATARTEYYTEPAALPIVEMSSIKNDLYRRDFTINSLAIKLNGANKNRLIDFFGGQQDLKDGILRVLHNLSFVEDPTRIFRAIRFEQRFGFAIGGQTERLLKVAVKKGLIDRISGSRLFGELKIIFDEGQPSKAIRRIADLGLWRLVHSAIGFSEKTERLCEKAEEAVNWHRLTFDTEKAAPWTVYLFCLSIALTKNQAIELMERLGFSREAALSFCEARQKAREGSQKLAKLSASMPVPAFEALSGLSEEALLTVMAAAKGREEKRIIAEFMTKLRYIKPRVSGNDLLKNGIRRGRLLGKVLTAIQRENLKGALPTKKSEIRFAKKFYGALKENFPQDA